MNQQVSINQVNVFSVPIYEVPVPSLAPHHNEIEKAFQTKIDSGELKLNKNGFGYQTPPDLLFEDAWPQPWFREQLAPAFINSCMKILQHAILDWSADTKFQWKNTITSCWGVVQTGTMTGDNPWHSHLPATLSGCYYVKLPKSQKEGNFQFMNPTASNIFQPKVGELRPREGHMLIFPSFLNHRPSMSPTIGNDLRISICLDGHFTTEML